MSCILPDHDLTHGGDINTTCLKPCIQTKNIGNGCCVLVQVVTVFGSAGLHIIIADFVDGVYRQRLGKHGQEPTQRHSHH